MQGNRARVSGWFLWSERQVGASDIRDHSRERLSAWNYRHDRFVSRRAKHRGLRTALLPLWVVAACCRYKACTGGQLFRRQSLWWASKRRSCRRIKLLAKKRQQDCTQSTVLRTPPPQGRKGCKIRFETLQAISPPLL